VPGPRPRPWFLNTGGWLRHRNTKLSPQPHVQDRHNHLCRMCQRCEGINMTTSERRQLTSPRIETPRRITNDRQLGHWKTGTRRISSLGQRPMAGREEGQTEVDHLKQFRTAHIHRLPPIFCAHLCPIQPLWWFPFPLFQHPTPPSLAAMRTGPPPPFPPPHTQHTTIHHIATRRPSREPAYNGSM